MKRSVTLCDVDTVLARNLRYVATILIQLLSNYRSFRRPVLLKVVQERDEDIRLSTKLLIQDNND